MPTFNVFVKDANTQQGIPNARVTVLVPGAQTMNPPSRYTSGDGGANLYYQGPPIDPPVAITVLVDAPGYAPFTTAADPVLFGSADVNYVAALSPSFKQPSRARVCAVREVFQGLMYNDIPMFAPFCYSPALNASQRDDWRNVELRAGATHATRCLSVEYRNDGGYTYPLPGYDYTQNLPGLKAMLAEDLRKGITPALYLAGDGQTYDPNGGTYGWSWLMQNQPRIVAALKDPTINGFDFTKLGVFCHGFELITYGGWSPDNFEAAVIALGNLLGGLNRAWGYIASHIGTYTWWGDGSGSHAGPVEDWANECGQNIDVCFEEGDAPFVTPDGTPIPGNNLNGWQQRASAHLGPASRNIDPPNQIVFEWPQQPISTQTPRGQRYCVGKETDEARWVRGAVSLQEILAEGNLLAHYGFQYISTPGGNQLGG